MLVRFVNKLILTFIYGASTVFSSCSISGKNVDIVDIGTRNRYANDANESPVARHRKVTSSFRLTAMQNETVYPSAAIGDLIRKVTP